MTTLLLLTTALACLAVGASVWLDIDAAQRHAAAQRLLDEARTIAADNQATLRHYTAALEAYNTVLQDPTATIGDIIAATQTYTRTLQERTQ